MTPQGRKHMELIALPRQFRDVLRLKVAAYRPAAPIQLVLQDDAGQPVRETTWRPGPLARTTDVWATYRWEGLQDIPQGRYCLEYKGADETGIIPLTKR